MVQSHPPLKLCEFVRLLAVWLVGACVLLTTVRLRSAQNPALPNSGEVSPPPVTVNNQAAMTTPNPKGQPEKSSLEKTKTDAAELSALADQLRDELNTMNANTLSLDVLQKAGKIKKLAKKIRGEANGH